MTRACFWFVTWLLAFAAVPAAHAQTAPNHIQPRLVAESSAPSAGATVMLAIEMRTERGWHGYWKYPGEAGVAPLFDWTLPRGATAGEPRFPVPRLLTVAGLVNYVFEGDHALLVPLTVPAGLARGSALPIRLKARWLACTDEVCVPESGDFALDLKIGDGTPDARTRFDGWRARLPMPLGATATFARDGKTLRLGIPLPASAPIAAPHFFPSAKDLIEDAAPQRFSRNGDMLVAELAAGSASAAPTGLLAIGDGRGIEIAAVSGAVPPAGTPIGDAPAAGPAFDWTTVLLALGGALLGGLILNVMPCVFPIVSLKALSLARAGGDAGAARRDALGYTAGAVAACLALGVLLLALRAGGASLGWAFQLQMPGVIVALLVLSTAIALNLAGLFELPVIGGNRASGGSFATGALAAFVATPCSGPFMGAALGAALVLPAPAALAIFAGLGLGLALPFLLIGFVPALRNSLPRPGPWMATLRRILSIPMFLTALALAWLLGRQAGIDAAVLGLGAALLVALVLWWSGLRQAQGKAGLAFAAAAAIAITSAAVAVLPVAPAATATASAGARKAEPFSETRLAELRAADRPVFVYFTADWCLTCKVNERIAIDRPEVVAAFARGNVATLVGDWTRADPAITRFLEAQGRAGVPLYLFYRPGIAQPETLPQILTPATLQALAS